MSIFVVSSTNHFKIDFLIRCLNCFNNLPADVVKANSVFYFKKLLNNIPNRECVIRLGIGEGANVIFKQVSHTIR